MAGEASRQNGTKGGRPKGARSARTVARAAGKARALKQAEITAERTMREIALQAFSRIGVIFDEQGQLRDLQTAPDDVQAIIASAKTLKTNVVSGDGKQETTREVRLWDKLRALDLLAKHFGLVTEKHQVEVGVSEELLAILRRRKGA